MRKYNQNVESLLVFSVLSRCISLQFSFGERQRDGKTTTNGAQKENGEMKSEAQLLERLVKHWSIEHDDNPNSHPNDATELHIKFGNLLGLIYESY